MLGDEIGDPQPVTASHLTDRVETGGVLVVIGTPIGNLGDITKRSMEELAAVTTLCCEDTRRTRQLLHHLGVATPRLLVANDHTESRVIPEVLARLETGERVGVVSDAGMPTVSDPGARIVAAAADAGFAVTVAPGPAAVTTALAISGLGGERFVFEGFLPRKGKARSQRLAELSRYPMPTVIYEAPHRVQRTLQDLADVCGPDRPLAALRELTKKFEQVVRGAASEVAEHFSANEPRGEFVIVVSAAERVGPPSDEAIKVMVRDEVARGQSYRDAAKLVTAATTAPGRHVYQLALEVKAEGVS